MKPSCTSGSGSSPAAGTRASNASASARAAAAFGLRSRTAPYKAPSCSRGIESPADPGGVAARACAHPVAGKTRKDANNANLRKVVDDSSGAGDRRRTTVADIWRVLPADTRRSESIVSRWTSCAGGNRLDARHPRVSDEGRTTRAVEVGPARGNGWGTIQPLIAE